MDSDLVKLQSHTIHVYMNSLLKWSNKQHMWMVVIGRCLTVTLSFWYKHAQYLYLPMSSQTAVEPSRFMNMLVLNTFLALSTSASLTMKHRRILQQGRAKWGECTNMQWIYDKVATVNYSTVKSLVLAKGQLYTYIQAFGNAQDIKAGYTSTL